VLLEHLNSSLAQDSHPKRSPPNAVQSANNLSLIVQRRLLLPLQKQKLLSMNKVALSRLVLRQMAHG
jgi:hypothetical protein